MFVLRSTYDRMRAEAQALSALGITLAKCATMLTQKRDAARAGHAAGAWCTWSLRPRNAGDFAAAGRSPLGRRSAGAQPVIRVDHTAPVHDRFCRCRDCKPPFTRRANMLPAHFAISGAIWLALVLIARAAL